jgi:hypothetical protein
VRRSQQKLMFLLKISSKTDISKKAEYLVLFIHKSCAFSRSLFAWESLQKKVKILSWPCKSFRFATNDLSCLLIYGAFRRPTSLHEVHLETTRFSLISGYYKN